MKRKWIVAAIGAALLSTAALAQWGPGMGGYGYGMGPGMMGGYGPGGESQGYGPGARGSGYGCGGYGYGHGYGRGMMGGGRGWGMGGGYGWAYHSLNLTDEQRDKIDAIAKEVREKQWGLMQTMHGLLWKSEGPGKASDADILKNFDAMTAVRREMLAARLDARKRMDAVLTKEQREELAKQQRRYGW